MSNLSVWLTPLWLIACGATIGSLLLLIAWGPISPATPPSDRLILPPLQARAVRVPKRRHYFG